MDKIILDSRRSDRTVPDDRAAVRHLTDWRLKRVGMTLFFVCVISFIIYTNSVSAEEVSNPPLFKLKGEVLEVEELKKPLGSAIYTIKDMSSGQTIKFLADRYRSLIKINDAVKPAGDVLGGSKVIMIYQQSEDQKLPEIVFAKVTNSYA